MTDSKDQKTTITLEPGQVAVVLGMEDGQISRQLFASPDVDAMLDDEHSDIPSMGRQAGQLRENEAEALARSAPDNTANSNRKPLLTERLEEPALS
jgi:hypothetical protein